MKGYVIMAVLKHPAGHVASCTPIGIMQAESLRNAWEKLDPLGVSFYEVMLDRETLPILGHEAQLLGPSEALLDRLLPPPGDSERADRIRKSLMNRDMDLIIGQAPFAI